jgi:hypothetical protein
VKLLVQFHRTGSSSSASSPSTITAASCPRVRERRRRGRERADLVARPGGGSRPRARERGEHGCAWATRARQAGPSEREKGSGPRGSFVFLFQKYEIVFSFIYFVVNYLEFQK